MMLEPLSQPVPYQTLLDFANNRLQEYKNCVYLHSAKHGSPLARYSFIGLSPFMTIESAPDCLDDSKKILDRLEALLALYPLRKLPGLPPFQGGLAGYLSYDLARVFEQLPDKALNDFPIPPIAVGAYDLVLSMDHLSQQAWIVSSGLPKTNECERQARALARLEWALAEIYTQGRSMPENKQIQRGDIRSNFTPTDYYKAVDKAIAYIKAGDIFQVNLSQCFSCRLPANFSAYQLFTRLQQHNPAPFAAFISLGDVSIISSSPERFIKIEDGLIEARPIKGTIRRADCPQEDQRLAKALLHSEKDCAENAMIVDLMRNDLAKICCPHSIKVTQFCGLETFETVHHLVSVIQGRLSPKVSFKPLLQALLAGGSITGAPKIRAMEIIDELEPNRRGAYCGNAFYYGFNGTFDSSILIRTFILLQNELYFSAGGAIVLDSKPEAEYAETLLKAKALIETLVS